ncbi:Ubiquitin fusion degradation protein 4 [Tilletia horrida]|nr:Ubiquitin fusion degradation protein 4 [Tilletia horrida]
MERDRHPRKAASSNRHNSRAADPTSASSANNKAATAAPSSVSSSSAQQSTLTPSKRSTSKRGRQPTTQEDQDEPAHAGSLEPSRNKGKGKEVVPPSAPIRRSSRHVSQPAHSPTLVSKAAQAAAASSSTSSRSAGKRPVVDFDASLDQLASKRSKPNPATPRRTSTSAAAPATRMTQKRNSANSSTSSGSSLSQSHSKNKGKSRSSRSSRQSIQGASLVAGTSSSSNNMDEHCGMNLDHADDSHVESKSAISEHETASALSKKSSSGSVSNVASVKTTKTSKSQSESKTEVDDTDGDGMIHDDEIDDDEDDDGEDRFEDEPEDDYDDGAEGPGDEGAFGMNIRAMAGYMTGLTGRFRSLLASLRARDDPQSQLAALQELSDLLIVSTEDSLAGYFPIDSFVRELVYIMGGPKPIDHSSSRGTGTSGGAASGSSLSLHDGDSSGSAELGVAVKKEEDEDAAMAAAIAAAAGFEDNGEVMLIACRCLANLMEAMPYAAHSVVSCGAIPVLCSKLIEITFIDLAEQVLQTLEKISIDHPAAITKEGGLNAMLQFLDFFNIHVQRTAMTTAANCCRKLTADSFQTVRDIMPIVQNVLTYADQRLVESACKCVVRIIDSYRHQPELLEQLITPELVGPLCELLLAASGGSGASTASVIIGSNIHTELLKALGTASKASPQVAVTLLDKNIVETLYQLLTGSASPRDITASNAASSGAAAAPAVSIEDVPNDNATTAAVAIVPDGSNVAVADMAVLQNLAQRPKEQIQDALSLIAELLPPLPRDGIFDSRAYSEKAHRRMLQKAKEKEREARRAAKALRKAASTSASSSKEKQSKIDADGDTEMAESSSNDAPSGMISSAAASSVDVNNSTEESSTEQSSSSVAAAASVVGSAPATTSASSTAAAPKPERTKSEREVAKEAANTKRIDKLKEHEAPVRRFSQLMLPTLVEVYAASVTLHVRTKALNAILKITSFMEAEDLGTILKDVPVANFVADILSSREHASLVLAALQMVELLFNKLPEVYQTVLRREGVMYEVDDIAAREPSGKGKAPEKSSDKTQTPAVKPEPVPVALPTRASAGSSLTLERSSSSSLSGSAPAPTSSRDPLTIYEHAVAGRGNYSSMINMAAVEADDANIWRARILRDRFAAETSGGDGGKRAGQALDGIKKLVAALSDKETPDVAAAKGLVGEVAALFGKRDEPISSFELLKSGLIESLYQFSSSSDFKLDLHERRRMLMHAFLSTNTSGVSPASILVRRLQESLSRLENVEITTALSSSGDDTRRSPTAILAKQLRLRLVAEDSTDIPRSCHQVVVTIHAIASFQSLNDYLRPKIAASAGSSSGSGLSAGASGSSGDTNSRLSNILAALSAAGTGVDPSMSAANALRQSLAALGASVPAAASTATPGGVAASSSAPRVTATTESKSTAGGSSGSADADKSVRRRSSRLDLNGGEGSGAAAGSSSAANKDGDVSGAADGSGAGPGSGAADTTGASGIESDEALARRLVEGLLNEGYDEDMFTDEEYEEEVLEDELPPDTSTEQAEKAVALKVGSNGDVQAETSAAAEPANDTAEASGSSSSAAANQGASTSSSASRQARSSYAAALQRKPSDWHLEFFMDNKPVNLKSTIYGAVHKYEASRSSSSSLSSRYIWQNIYTVTYKKVAGPAPADEPNATPEPEDADSAAIVLPESIPKDAPYATILQLLGVMHDLNDMWRLEDVLPSGAALDAHSGKVPALAESSFINNKLTAKLNRQLEEPMIVASSCLPGWCMDLPRVFPFLFPFEARYSYLQSTSFGYARLLTKWQSQHSRTQDSSSRRDDSFGFLSRLQRQKVRISRSRLFESAMKVFELYGHNTSVLEVEYFEEVGTGLGPTLEFYALVSREFARRDLGIWRDDGNGSATSKFVSAPHGLFPAPQSTAEVASEEGKQRLTVFKTLGQFVAKALLDSRIIDCNFSPVFMKAVLNAKIPVTLASLRAVDPALARSMDQLLVMDTETLDAMALDFTLPGHPSIELVEDGRSKAVTKDNLREYVDAIINQTVHEGVQPAVRAFRRGFNLIMPLEALSSFTADELVMLFGNMDEDWSEATLLASIKPDHGFNSESASFRDLVAIMANFDGTKRREFLQWLTGSPKLPIGGFAGLHPQLTIVKRPHEAPLAPDDYLPSVMTCVNYLKMPGYSSREKMRRRLETAMSEGSGSFYLS